MKKTILFVLFGMWVPIASFAQSEGVGDSIPPISLDGSRYQSFDGFLLDMGSMLVAPPQLLAPQLTYRPYNDNGTFKNYNELFRPWHRVTYDRGTYYFPFTPFSSFPTLQSATFRLRNGLRITTYGEYDANGYKVRNPGALPWQRNNFHGALELKSGNGNFGVRIEMQRGRIAP